MKALINNSLLTRIASAEKQYDIWDTKLKGFILRVHPNGNMFYRCEYARGKRFTIGNSQILTPTQARDRAKEVLADAVKGVDPLVVKRQKKITLKSFIETEYQQWAKAHRKSGIETVARIKRCFFQTFGDKSLETITILDVEKWRTRKLNLNRKSNTVNRDIITLKAAISKAVEWEIIQSHPLAKLRPLKADGSPKIRYLERNEESNLRRCLDMREEQLKAARDRANEWRRNRGYELLPNLYDQSLADYLKPMVLLSINTGLRRGELFNLTWDNIDLKNAILTVSGDSAKSGKTRHIPLNDEALNILKVWRNRTEVMGLVFSNNDGQRFGHVKKSWSNLLKEAGIENFRWHDLRHHFASKLVMAAVDLNTVRELLGHADIKMTLRYAHLAPEHKAQAVAKLLSIK